LRIEGHLQAPRTNVPPELDPPPGACVRACCYAEQAVDSSRRPSVISGAPEPPGTPNGLGEAKGTIMDERIQQISVSWDDLTHGAPSIHACMTGIAMIQDALAHAHIASHILEELGEDQEKLIFSRDPKSFRYPYAFDVPLESWTELIVANAFYDQAGFCLLGDIHDKCSYGPWKRGLNKVMLEENFHLRNGRTWMKRISQAGGAAKDELQHA